MKKILTLALAFSCGAALAQKADNVGIGTSKPDPSAILDLNSNTKGLLLPRMSEAQRNAIKNPAAGLIIFQTDQVVGTYTFDGTAWQPSNARTSAINVAGAWDKRGNAIDADDFLGSTNGEPLRFKSGNEYSGYIGVYPNTNTFFGYRSGVTNTLVSSSGNGNVAIGSFAMEKNTSGSGNFAIGTFALRENISGGSNFAMGINALYNNKGSYNLGIGPNSLLANTFGESNTGIGQNALTSNTTGTNNIGIGQNVLFNSVSGSENIAIGNSAGHSNSIGSKNIFIGYNAGYSETQSNKLYIANSNTVSPLIKGDFATGNLRINVKPQVGGITNLGSLAIGDFDAATSPQMPTPIGYRLIVQDGILTEKLKVALRTDGANWADYVFEPTYKLMPLEEVEKYTKDNKHLPNVPSADEITKEGIDVAKVSKMFMEKIEELTLHIIELNKRIKDLEVRK